MSDVALRVLPVVVIEAVEVEVDQEETNDDGTYMKYMMSFVNQLTIITTL